MDMQNVAKLDIPEGEVRTIHDKDGNLIWGKISYGVKYKGDTAQNGIPTPSAPVAVQTVTGENVVRISDGQGNEQSYGVNLGKNLFDPAIAAHPSGMPNNLGETLRVDANTIYTFNVGNDRTFAQVQLFDNTGTRTRTLGNGVNDHTLTFTTTASEVSGLFCFYPGQAGVDPTTYDYTGVQLEKGSQATSYAAYFTPIELCKIDDFQDYVYKSGGKWYVHKEIGKVTLNSSNYNSRYGTNQYGLTQFLVDYGVSDYYDTTNYTNMMSDHFVKQLTGFANTQTQGFLPALNSSTHQLRAYVRILTTTADTTDQFKAWLNANTPTFYYKLDTATDTEITNAALTVQLDTVEQLLIRYGYNSTVSGNLPIIIDRTAL